MHFMNLTFYECNRLLNWLAPMIRWKAFLSTTGQGVGGNEKDESTFRLISENRPRKLFEWLAMVSSMFHQSHEICSWHFLKQEPSVGELLTYSCSTHRLRYLSVLNAYCCRKRNRGNSFFLSIACKSHILLRRKLRNAFYEFNILWV